MSIFIKDDIEKIQSEPMQIKEISQVTPVPKKQKKNKKKDDHHNTHNNNTNQSLPHQSHTPHPPQSQQPIIPSTVNKEPQISLAPEDFKDRNEDEMRKMMTVLFDMKGTQLEEIAKNLGAKPEDDVFRFDFLKISDSKYKAVKDKILKK